MGLKESVKGIIYKVLPLASAVVLVSASIMPKATAEAKTYKKTILLEKGDRWGFSGSYEWKNTNVDIAYGMGNMIVGLTKGKTTITGKDKNNNKYIYNVNVIKPIELQVKKVNITNNKVKYTIKNLGKKAIKFGKKVSFHIIDASFSYYANMDKDVTIKPKETKVLTINPGKDETNKKYTFNDKSISKHLCDMTFDITYNGKDMQYVLLAKPVKNTAKKSPEISSEVELINEGGECIISMLNTNKKVKWSILSGKNVIKIQKKGKHYVKIKGTGAGEAVLQAKAGGKKYKSTIVVAEREYEYAYEYEGNDDDEEDYDYGYGGDDEEDENWYEDESRYEDESGYEPEDE